MLRLIDDRESEDENGNEGQKEIAEEETNQRNNSKCGNCRKGGIILRQFNVIDVR